jgi:hypothetical protein
VVEHLPTKHEALTSTPSTITKKTKNNKKLFLWRLMSMGTSLELLRSHNACQICD